MKDLEVWRACREVERLGHSLCPGEVLAQEAWATAGDPPPSADARPVRLTRCPCSCHRRGA